LKTIREVIFPTKITVLRKMFNEDFAHKYCKEKVTPCPVFKEDQEFIHDPYRDGKKPEDFCENAWQDINKVVFTLASNGSFPTWMKNENSIISCFTDGIRPVVFNIERIKES
jgi:uncharacterized repeat protein (TIGR04076 family)